MSSSPPPSLPSVSSYFTLINYIWITKHYYTFPSYIPVNNSRKEKPLNKNLFFFFTVRSVNVCLLVTVALSTPSVVSVFSADKKTWTNSKMNIPATYGTKGKTVQRNCEEQNEAIRQIYPRRHTKLHLRSKNQLR